MVGQSWGIYRGCCRFMGDSLKGSDSPAMGVPEAALCALRSQLLMALHDSNAQHPTQTPFSFTQVRSLAALTPCCASRSILAVSWAL